MVRVILYVDWTGKRCRKLKRGFATKKEAQEWEMHFKLQKASSLDMSFGDFYKIYDLFLKNKFSEEVVNKIFFENALNFFENFDI